MIQENQDNETIHLSDYLNVVLKFKKLIITLTVVTAAVVLLMTFAMPSVYQATSQVVIDKEQTLSPLTGQMTDRTSYMDQQLSFNTHFELIKSKPVLLMVIEDLKLDQPDSLASKGEPSFFSRIKAQIKSNVRLLKNSIKSLLGKEKQELSEEEKMDDLVHSIRKMIKISQVPDTRLLTISVESTDPGMASLVANSVAESYVKFDMGSRLASSKESLEWMNNEMYRVKKRLEDDEQKFHEYKQLNKLFSVEGKQKVISQKIQEFNNEYLRARNERQELDAQLNQISQLTAKNANDIDYIRSIVNNEAINTIYNNITNLELEKTRLSKVFKAKHPKIVQNESELEKNRLELKNELQKEIDNLKSQRTVLLAKEQVMEQNIAEFEKDAVDASGKELRYSILQRNLETSQNLYDTLVAKVKESGVMSSGATSNIRIVERAITPLIPIGPNKKRNLMLAIILGLFGGTCLAFFLEYIDQSMKTEEDVNKYLDLPVLSLIPSADPTDNSRVY